MEFVADFGSSQLFGSDDQTTSKQGSQNVGGKVTNNANADFADFEHNTIFNASGNLYYD